MLYIFYGNDESKAREKAQSLIRGLQYKAPDAELVRITSEEQESGVGISGLLGTQGLFKSNYIIFLDNLSEEPTPEEQGAMQESAHVCVVLAGKLNPKTLEQYKKHANKITEYKLSAPNVKFGSGEFNVFSVANALKACDKQRLWQGLAEARLAGAEPEAIVGILFWAVKDMLIKKQGNKWSEAELKEMVIIIAGLPHKSRREGLNLYSTIERFALTCA